MNATIGLGGCVRLFCALPFVLLAQPASAQRADENAATAAEDGFGKSVGDESVGIYASGNVRGFSAYDAGNARIEGLYFNESGSIIDLTQSGSDIRLGLTAFGQPFPAPTGIVDTSLARVKSERAILSARATVRPYWGYFGVLEAAVPVSDSTGVNAGVRYTQDKYADGTSAWFLSYGGVARWKAAKDVELTTFFSRYDYGDEGQGPAIYTSGAFLPPKVERFKFYGQDWAQWAGHSQNYGALAKAALGDWKFEAGLFNSRFTQDDFASAWFDGVNAQGTGREFVLSGQDQSFASTSGELRVVRDVKDGKRQHRFVASARGRNVRSQFGGYALADLGPGQIGVRDPEAEPDYTYGPLTDDRVKQRNYSVGYDLRWQRIGELNLGITRTDYRKIVAEPQEPVVSRQDRFWLWNAALALSATNKLSLYAATTRGLEESGTAPSNTANANEALPALRTRQIEAGLRYVFPRNMRLVAAAFDIRKPYFETDVADNVYRILGNVRHRGIELSLSGEPVDGLSIVTGALFLQPRVTGEAVEDGRLGTKPLGRTPTFVDLNVDYRFPRLKALSVDVALQYEGKRIANIENSLSISARTTVDLGARYRFTIGKSPALFRFQIANITNIYGWRVFSGGAFKPNNPRGLSASLKADF